MFIDEKTIRIRAGKGGDGAALFRREIYVPKGGPDGGDGGDGGDVYIVGQSNLHALNHLAHIEKIEAGEGKIGGHRTSTGKSGEDKEIVVPLGTVVEITSETGEIETIEVTEEGQRLLVAKGGHGGWGNWHFRSSIQQAPERFNPGQPGEQKKLHLTLKLIADIGLIGFPNAGKSTFLSVVSAARPKIADYPFTTLEPQLGVAEVGGEAPIVIADLPGLIEGASHGKGLGVAFLKHIERTRAVAHFIESTTAKEELFSTYQTIRQELEQWSATLASKPEIVCLSKVDLLLPEEVEEKCAVLQAALGKKVYPFSAASHQGITELLTAFTK